MFLGLLKNQVAISRVQAELDTVIGSTRLPTFEDRPQLPYLEAVVMEGFRWIPTLPLALPRMTSSDDIYRGYFIPKGTIVTYNIWYVRPTMQPHTR